MGDKTSFPTPSHIAMIYMYMNDYSIRILYVAVVLKVNELLEVRNWSM